VARGVNEMDGVVIIDDYVEEDWYEVTYEVEKSIQPNHRR
jgi:hypothetical protein